jgi:hypothetical protein
LSPVCAANTIIDGSCGTSNNSNVSSIPTTNLCSLGDATSVTGVGPWSWTCTGIRGGTTASCQTGGVPVNGSCGTSNNQNLSSIPSTNLCTLGNATVVSGSGPWTWSCTGLNTGSTASCSANKIINGSCGTANKTYAYSDSSYGSDTFCTLGTTTPTTPAFPDNGATTNWTCVGLNTGSTASCSASRNAVPVNGSCGTANNSNSYSIPTTNLCALGNATVVSGSGPWTWTCTGLNGGTTSGTCTVNLSVNGACGTKNGKYASATPTGTQACTTGTITGMTGSYSWTCTGLYGGTSPSCSTVAATYAAPVIFTTVGTSSWTVPGGVTSVEYLVVGGGGGGGMQFSGAGGGGGVKTGSISVSGSISVVVGVGGAARKDELGTGYSGSSSSFSSISVSGGGGGGASNGNGANGGNGGGGGLPNGDGVTLPGGTGVSGEGNAGGGGIRLATGGGGGAGAVGQTGNTRGTNYGGNGGNGLLSSITGTATYYAGGGGGCGWAVRGDGGLGGGGYGASGSASTSGTNGLGGGGGGACGYDGQITGGGAGGSGIVVIRYINNY